MVQRAVDRVSRLCSSSLFGSNEKQLFRPSLHQYGQASRTGKPPTGEPTCFHSSPRNQVNVCPCLCFNTSLWPRLTCARTAVALAIAPGSVLLVPLKC